MPQIFRFGSYWVYFWVKEGDPLEPVHVHISQGNPSSNSTKIWITKNGKCSLAHNNSRIPAVILNKMMRVIENRSFEIISKWKENFGEVKFYC